MSFDITYNQWDITFILNHATYYKVFILNIIGSLLFSGKADSEKLQEEMERAKYDAEMKAAAEEELTKSQQTGTEPEKTGIQKRIREGKDDKVFKVS